MRAVHTALRVANAFPLACLTRTPSLTLEYAAQLGHVARFMGLNMNREIWSGASLGLAMIAIASCADGPTSPGIGSDDLTADQYRSVATVQVTLASSTIAVGQTTQASAVLRDRWHRVVYRTVSWTSSDTTVAVVSSSGLVRAIAAGSVVITGEAGWQSGGATLTVTSTSQTQPAPVASLSVVLAAASLSVGQTTQASVVARDSSNNVLPAPAVIWSSGTPSVATVSNAGVVTAAAAGSAAIKASVANIEGASTVTVSATAPVPVASVSVSPGSDTIQIGTTASFSATTRDASNNVLTGRVVAWSSGNTSVATVNSGSGVVTAVAAGTVQITATSEGKSASATVLVPAVVTPPPPPPPPPGSSNEPSGMTTIADRAFNSLQEGSWYTDTKLSIVQDATAPKSPSGVLRASYPAGFAGGTSAGPAELQFTGYKTLYMSYWAKYSANWQGHNTGINKHCYVWVTENGGYTPFVMEAEGSGSGPLKPRPILQRMIVGDGPYEPNLVPSATITRDKWFHVEVVIVGNSAGTADGTMDIYLDGVHVTSVSRLQWSSGATRFYIFQFYPVWGGIGDTVDNDQWFEWDHVYLSGK